MNLRARSSRNFFPKMLALVGCFSICVAASFKVAQPRRDAPARVPEIYRVVDAELCAMRALDAESADDLSRQPCDPRLQRLRFVDLKSVRTVEFGAVRQNGDCAEVDLFFIRRDARVLPCVFDLVRDGGQWKVEGARFLEREKADCVARSLRI